MGVVTQPARPDLPNLWPHRPRVLLKAPKSKNTVITVSRQPGSGGNLVAQGIAEKLGLDLFHQQVIHEMAESANVSARFVQTLDEKAMTVLDEWIASLVDDRHLWPDQYLQHLMKVVGTIGEHGSAVMVGRGANFIVPPSKRMRVRIMAPMGFRIKSVADTFGVTAKVAKRRVVRTESDRRAFIRKYFNADIDDPANSAYPPEQLKVLPLAVDRKHF